MTAGRQTARDSGDGAGAHRRRGFGRKVGEMRDYRKEMDSYLKKEMEVIARLDLDAINAAVNAIHAAFLRDADIYIFGNGGSAAIASHFANDFNKGISGKRGRKFRMHCLSDNIATLTAIANDIHYDEVFRLQLDGVLRPSDLVIGISGSGDSPNILNAIEYAKEIGAPTIGITGYAGGKLKQRTDYHMDANVEDMQIAEDLFMIFDHLIVSVF
jgi:D-sedoheptulose 7-phosphate isomerase